MHSKILAFAAGLSLAASVGAQAMPVGPSVPVAGPSALIQKTAEGCGRGFAPGPSGVCRPIARVVEPRRVVVVPERRVVVVPPRVVVRPAPCAGVRVGPVAVRGC